MGLVDSWISGFPEPQKKAVAEAIEAASLSKTRRALRLLDDLSPGLRGPDFSVELLSTYNLEPILPFLELALGCIPSRVRLRIGPLNDIEGQLSQATDAERCEARAILWRVEELLPEALYPFSNGFPEQLAACVDKVVERVERVVNLHERHAAAVPLFLSTVALPLHLSNPLFASQDSAALCASVARINCRIYEIATRRGGIYVLDFCRWAALEGWSHADALLDFMARQPFSAKGQVSFALFLARSLRPLMVPSRKVLAVDLDDTLWGGAVGEEGVDNLRLGHDFPGNVHLRIQRELLELRKRGILLVLLSKNNEADARQAFELLPDMILKWDDFAVRKVNWNGKHENLREAARELGLGTDSFAFLDDSDYERDLMCHLLPEVLILNRTSDPLHALHSLWATDAFDTLAITEEDRRRHYDYRVRAVRNVGAHKDDLDEFLESLQMEATIEEIGLTNIERVVAMLGKTNQFNLTTRRHSRAEVQSMIAASGTIGLALRLRDKFGDQGIVAVSLAIRGRQDATLVVDSFLVSCRALGRGVEDSLWSALLERAADEGIRRLQTEYLTSPKNALAANFYNRLGLQPREHSAASVLYVLDPVEVRRPPAWIKIRKNVDGKQ